MSVTRVGTNKKYSDNWDNIFSGGKRQSSPKQAAAKPAKKSPKKSPKKSTKSAAKTAGKKHASKTKRKAR